jgi:hypothetical protein
MWAKDAFAIVPPGSVIPVKAVCDSPTIFRHIFSLEGDAQGAAVQHYLDTESCILLPVPMPMKVRLMVDTFHTPESIITVYEMDLENTEGNWYAFTYQEATRT